MTNTELLASLTTTVERDGTNLGTGYIDWSVKTDDGRSIEVGDGETAIVLDATWAQIARFQQALTVLLLEHQAE